MGDFQVRDLRRKTKFFIDDEYLNGYAKICGINATGVYVSLCRHADKKQGCFPSIKLMAKELAISESSIKRALITLEKHQIIYRNKRERNKKGKWMNNYYFLLDKKLWISSPQVRQTHGVQGSEGPHPGVRENKNQGSEGPTKVTHVKDTHIRSGFKKRLRKEYPQEYKRMYG